MKQKYTGLKSLALLALAAFALCWIGVGFFRLPPQAQDTHALLHRELHITPEQDKQLGAMEQHFQVRKAELEATIKKTNAELAASITEDKHYSIRVKAAVDNINHAQGELQKAVLEHLFAMQEILTPAQSEKLNRMAADALLRNH